MNDDDATTPAARYRTNGHLNGHTPIGDTAVGWRGLSDDSAVPVPAAGPDDQGLPGPAAVDAALVRSVRRVVADQLAVRLHGGEAPEPGQRRELARGLIARELAARNTARAQAGENQWPFETRVALGDAVMAALFGLGRLQPLVDDQGVENIEIDGHDQVWTSYADGRDQRVAPVADSDVELIEMLQALAARSGSAERTFTSAHPALHLRLEDGSRLAAVAWVTPKPHVVIRRHRVRDVDLDDLVDLGTLDPVVAAFLRAAVLAGKNIVVTGLQNAGKTTLIRALANEFDPMERFATIEKEYELHLHDLPHRHPRVVAMEAREGSAEKDGAGGRAGQITLSDLVVDALRLNLRRIIVGEVRGPEVLPMLEAMSTSDGSLCTVHARTAAHGIDRIVTLCYSAGVAMSDAFAYRLLAGSVDLIVHLTLLDQSIRGGAKHRFVSTVLELGGLGENGRPATTTVFGPGADGRAVPLHRPDCLDGLVRAGFDVAWLERRQGAWPRPLDLAGGR